MKDNVNNSNNSRSSSLTNNNKAGGAGASLFLTAEFIRLVVVGTIVGICAKLSTSSMMKIMTTNSITTDRKSSAAISNSNTLSSSSSSFRLNYTTIAINSTEQNKAAITLPEVMLIGSQKTGTSALATLLYEGMGACRPKVFWNEPYYYDKECHFFDLPWRYIRGPEFYASRYEHCIREEDATPVVDATPGYFIYAERVRQTYEDAERRYRLSKPNLKRNLRFIAMLREPIARELSVYNHKAWLWTRKPYHVLNWYNDVGKPDGSVKSFTEYAVESTIPNLTTFDVNQINGATNYHLGYYSHHLRQWFKNFDRSQILLLNHEEFKNTPQITIRRIVDFLDVEHTTKIDKYVFPHENMKESDDKVRIVACSAVRQLSKYFDEINNELYDLLDEHSIGRPTMEEYPFRRFKQPECQEDDDDYI